jgi:hypothetical protein
MRCHDSGFLLLARLHTVIKILLTDSAPTVESEESTRPVRIVAGFFTPLFFVFIPSLSNFLKSFFLCLAVFFPLLLKLLSVVFQ